jgi:hypothetical protein
MRKARKAAKRPVPNGSIAQLEHMVDRSVARGRDAHGSPPLRGEFDTFFDMIDSRLTQLLTKSNAIDIRLGELEVKSRSGSRTRKKRLAADELPSLNEAISALSTQITAARNEQQILRSRVAELHRAALSDDF